MSGYGTGSVAAPAVAVEEPLTVDEVKRHCRIDQSNQELAPTALTCALISPAVAGNVDNGAHRYRVTFVTADGETEGGTVSSAVTVADKTVNGKVSLTAIPVGGALVTSRKIYRTAAGGSTYLLLTTLSDNTTTTYTDNTADSSLGAAAPSTNTTDDPYISMLIKRARQQAEHELKRYLITQTRDIYFDCFPDHGEYIYLPPIQSVTQLSYVDTAGDTQVWASTNYRVDAVSKPARIAEEYAVTWPSIREVSNSVIVRVVAGYGARADVPACIKLWMLQYIKHHFDNPGTNIVGTNIMPIGRQYIDALLDPERVYGRA